jgi:hypothetical protein
MPEITLDTNYDVENTSPTWQWSSYFTLIEKAED